MCSKRSSPPLKEEEKKMPDYSTVLMATAIVVLVFGVRWLRIRIEKIEEELRIK